MYKWWRFQRYLICPKRLKIKISIRLDDAQVTREDVVKKHLSVRNCSNIKTAAFNLNYLPLNVFRFTLVTNLIFRIIFVYSFTLNFFILLFPTFCNKLILPDTDMINGGFRDVLGVENVWNGALHLHTRSKFPFRVFGPS